MSTHKHIDVICIGIVVVTLLLTVLFMNGRALGIEVISGEENSDAMFTENDLNAAWDTSDATTITLSDDGSTINGNGAYDKDGDICIVYAGKYVISGTLSDGTIRIEADGDDKIWLMLSNASVHCEDDAAIRIEQAGKVFLTLQDGTKNALSSGASYSEEAVSGSVDGTIYARDDLTINGTGSLTVDAAYQHGIVCNDDFAVTGGTLTVTSVQDAIHANDSVRLRDANITLTAGDDAITASNDEETSFFYMESGTVSIPSCYEGIEAVQVTITGGTLNISPSDDGINANGDNGTAVIDISGGSITITNENGRDADGIDSNQDIFIRGGNLFISVGDAGGSCAIDYGSENGGICQISGGTVLACGSSGMAEGFDASSSQGFLMSAASASAGTAVTVKNADGDALLSETVPYSFSSVLVSTPDMHIGDTCTLSIGDTETEMTIDNASNTGAFGGGQMPGGNAGMQPPAMSDGANGGTPPDFPQGGMDADASQPDFPQDGTADGTQPDTFQGEMNGDNTQSGFPQRGMHGGGMMQGNDNFGGKMDNMQTQDTASQPTDNGTPIPAGTWILLGVSALVLLIGCLIACFYKRRG